MRIRRRLSWALLALLPLVPFVAVMFQSAQGQPIQRNLTVELNGLPPGTRPLKIVLLSDLHVAKIGDTPARLRETVSRVTALRPDLILVGGDFFADELLGAYGVDDAIRPLAALKAPLGVFAVLGNHDNGDANYFRGVLGSAGIELLDNRARRAGPLTIVGVSGFTRFIGTSWVAAAIRREGGVPIVLTHGPDIIPRLPADVELAMAGHTHCGQIVLPFLGPLETRSRYGRRYACGVVREGRRVSVITGGLGVSGLPFRLNAPPDFWAVTVVPRRK